MSPRRTAGRAHRLPHRLPQGLPQRPPWRTDEVLADDGTPLAVHALGPPAQDAEVTVLLAHGWTLTSAAWDAVALRLAARLPRAAVVAYDQRGHGGSSPGGAPASMALLARDLAAVLAARAPTGPLVVAAQSMGAMAVLVAVGADPSLLAGRRCGVLLCSSTAGGRGWLGRRGGAAPLMRGLAHLPAGWQLRRLPTRLVARVSYAPGTPTDVVAATNAAMGAVSLRSIGAWFGAFAVHDAADALPALAASGAALTVLVGGADPLTPPGQSRALADALPGARLRVAPGAGHMLLVERPDLVADEIADLVRRRVMMGP